MDIDDWCCFHQTAAEVQPPDSFVHRSFGVTVSETGVCSRFGHGLHISGDIEAWDFSV